MNKFLLRLTMLLALAGTATCVLAQKTYVVAVGLGTYENNWQNDLGFGPGDAKAIANLFHESRDSDVFLLLNSNATRDHILRVAKNKFGKATEKDEIIFAYTGHGFDGGISCYNVDGIIYNYEIQNIMKQSKATRKMIFMGSCHSGSFSKKYQQNIATRPDYRSNSSNVILFMGSRADESSWGYTVRPCSFFITRVIEGLKGRADNNSDHKVTVRELFNYISPLVYEDSDGQQHPQIYGKFDDDMVIIKLRK